MTARHTLGAARVSVTLLSAACSPAPQHTLTTAPMTAMQAALADTRGPNGEPPTASSALTRTDAEADRIRGGHYTAAF